MVLGREERGGEEHTVSGGRAAIGASSAWAFSTTEAAIERITLCTPVATRLCACFIKQSENVVSACEW